MLCVSVLEAASHNTWYTSFIQTHSRHHSWTPTALRPFCKPSIAPAVLLAPRALVLLSAKDIHMLESLRA